MFVRLKAHVLTVPSRTRPTCVGVVVQGPSKPEVKVLGPRPRAAPSPQVPGQGSSGCCAGEGPGPPGQAPGWGDEGAGRVVCPWVELRVGGGTVATLWGGKCRTRRTF